MDGKISSLHPNLNHNKILPVASDIVQRVYKDPIKIHSLIWIPNAIRICTP
jgi:hypothetical protein